jgi:alpha-tubulin suppressor-like RCC1 family protein
MGKNLVRKIFLTHRATRVGTSFTIPPGVNQITLTVLDRFDRLLAIGSTSSYALKKTGAAFAWGLGTTGELGDNTILSKSTPVPVAGGHSFVQLTGATTYAAALKADGSVWAWGLGTGGQLGDNTAVSKSVPTTAAGNHSFIQIAAIGTLNGAALKADGSIWAWGSNNNGQLGTGVGPPGLLAVSSPVPVTGGRSFGQLCTSEGNSMMGVLVTGGIFAWGNNAQGQLGDNTTIQRSSPVLVQGGNSFIRGSMGATHSVALKADGSVWCWGSNTVGQLGNGLSDPGGFEHQSTPVAVVGGHSFIQIAASTAFTLALKADGSAWGWGTNLQGQLGLGTTTPQTTSSPVPVIGGHSFIQLDACNSTSSGLKSDGTVWTWGLGTSGQLGDNTAVSKSSPVIVAGTNLFEAGIVYNNKRTFDVTPGAAYILNAFLTQIGNQTIASNAGNNVYIVLEYYA